MSEYGCKHLVSIRKDPDGVPAVILSNDDDGYYVQYFTEPGALDEFVDRLEDARIALWGDRPHEAWT